MSRVQRGPSGPHSNHLLGAPSSPESHTCLAGTQDAGQACEELGWDPFCPVPTPSSCPFSRHPHLASTTGSGWRQTAPHSGHGRAPTRRQETPTRHSASCNLFMSLLRSRGSFPSPPKMGSSCHKTPSLASALHTETHICTHTLHPGASAEMGAPHPTPSCSAGSGRGGEGISQAEKEGRSGGQDGCLHPPQFLGEPTPATSRLCPQNKSPLSDAPQNSQL